MSRPAPHSHYPIIAALCLVFSVTAAPYVVFVSIVSESPLLRALAFLSGPVTFLVWIIVTVRALHLLGLGYWSLTSTYVSLLSEGAAIGLACLAVALQPNGSHAEPNATVLYAAGLVALGSQCWCGWYNWKRTGSALLAFSVTVLQLTTSSLIMLLLMLRSRPPEKSRGH
ncbi:type IV secretory pathway VirB2 component (pilin) [Bradyrhizobium sp. i1.8.4]